MSDQDPGQDGNLPTQEEDSFEDFLPAPALLPKRGKKLYTSVGGAVRVPEPEIPIPAPVFHDTPIENHIDSDLEIQNQIVKAKVHQIKAAKTLAEQDLALKSLETSLEKRRRLANKQLGAAPAHNGKEGVFYIPD